GGGRRGGRGGAPRAFCTTPRGPRPGRAGGAVRRRPAPPVAGRGEVPRVAVANGVIVDPEVQPFGRAREPKLDANAATVPAGLRRQHGTPAGGVDDDGRRVIAVGCGDDVGGREPRGGRLQE